ncbi:type II secretion system F family protein [Clostridium felsineum]|uniref:Uncharacterized protein n=1 Tax=Clostridium felsineum TaxID=36839 RepID=A0A1S8L4R1_9CLOT|nr:type II secretion system F family protein [Clostridium felsineum]MCR3761440.1 type II secretion system F family protein [Clostridium felsineum]URZ00632.1 hypothetical protein CLAUR_006200 [Clostridium felsineum]URZ06727.1 hypothetical protein CLROS_020600 [Clostridium felsineum]URZ11760.1 hypothetical protein CROST_024770 [Clostridium felsineum]
MKLYIILNSIFILVTFLLAYEVSYKLVKGDRGKLKAVLHHFDKKYRERLIDKKVNRVYREKRQNSILNRLDKIIYMSGIRKYFKYMSSEVFAFGVFIISFLFSILIFELYKSLIFSVVAFLAVPIIFYGILKEMMQINFDKIDNNIMFFISSLKSNAEIKNNIVFMIGETTKKLKEPLKTYNDDFIRDVRFGISIDKAFENYINKVENVRFKNILKNLYICSLNNANYSKLLDKTRIIVRNYYEEKEKRKRKVRAAQISITVIVIMAVIILNALSKVTENFSFLIMNTRGGQVLLGYILCVILFAAYKCISLKKFNY